MKKVIFILIFIFIVLFIFSCSNVGNPPVLNSVYITDIYGNLTSTASIGDILYIHISAEDEDKDMELLNTKSYLNGEFMYETEYTLPPTNVVKQLYYIIVSIIGPVGNWRIELTIFDSKGNGSNIYTVYFTVI